MSISSKQIRAARGLLDLSQKELAHRAGLSINSLNNIERETVSPRTDSMNAIRNALEREGVEFLDKDGVRLSGEILEIEKFEEPEVSVNLFYDDCLREFPTGNGELLVIGKDNNRFRSHDPNRLLAYKRFEAIALRNNIKERAIFLENDTNFLAVRNHYRWVPKELFGEVPMAIYGDNVAIILWGPPLRMIIIRNQGIAKSFRQHFDAIWSLAKPVPDEVYKFHYKLKTQAVLDAIPEKETAPAKKKTAKKK